MKNRKWLTYTLGALLTLVVLAVVGVAGFRVGMTQNASFTRPAFARNFDSGVQSMQRNPQDASGNQPAQGNSRNQGFKNHGSDRRGGGMPFFAPIFRLIHLAVLGLLLWFGYKFVKNSGWRITREPATSKLAEDEEKKASE